MWDRNVGDWRVTCAGLDGLSACRCQMPGQAAPDRLRGCCQISSQRPLACWQRRVRMPVAPGWVQCMPDSLRRCPMIALHPASMGPSNCTSGCLLLSSVHVPGHGGPSAERRLDLSGEGDADRASGSLAAGKVASPQPVVNGARLDAETGGDLAHGQLAGV